MPCTISTDSLLLLFKELIEFLKILLFAKEDGDYKLFLANILIFFLYFEFITMIIKYFKEDYHFPLRYFIYIGITAMIRLIIVEHDHPLNTLIYSLIILILIISYFIINITPLERPTRSSILIKKIKSPHAHSKMQIYMWAFQTHRRIAVKPVNTDYH